MAGLARMANRDHRWVEIQPGDTVIVSASPIPGNEEVVGRTIDNLFKVGANVFYHDIKRAHVSGHASQEELKLMLNLTRPKHFIPVHGEFRMLVQHGRIAQELGVEANNIFIIENGQPIEFPEDGTGAARHAGRGRLRLRRRAVGGRGRRRRAARPACARERRHVPRRGHGRQADRQHHRPARDRHAWLRGRPRRPGHRCRRRTRHDARSRTRATTSASPACSRRRSRTACRSTCTTAPSAGRWSSRSWSRSRAHGHPSAPLDTCLALTIPKRSDREGAERPQAAAARRALADRPDADRHRHGHAHRPAVPRGGHLQSLRHRSLAAGRRPGRVAAGRLF